MPKSILVHLNNAPFGNSNAKEALDLVLAAGTFEQDVAFLLSGDACYLVLEAQETQKIDQKNIRQMMKALGIYGVDEVYVDESDALERNIPLDDSSLRFTKLSKAQVAKTLRSKEAVIRF